MMYTELDIMQKITKPAAAFSKDIQFVNWRSNIKAAKTTTFFGHCLGRMVLMIALSKIWFQ